MILDLDHNMMKNVIENQAYYCVWMYYKNQSFRVELQVSGGKGV